MSRLPPDGYEQIDGEHARLLFAELIQVDIVAEEYLFLAMHCWRNLILKLGRRLHKKEFRAIVALIALLKSHIRKHPKVAVFFKILVDIKHKSTSFDGRSDQIPKRAAVKAANP
jgi:hypothetical protein